MATANPATIYYCRDGHYIILDDVTNDIVQGSKLFDLGWLDEYYLPRKIPIQPRPKP